MFTIRVVPSAAVCGTSGTGCSRARSISRRSAGTAHVSRCTRPFTTAQNPSHARASSAKLPYASSRFASAGTRSALATRTVASDPPFDSGSYGTQVCTVIP